ncbi:hypothetical protein AA13595_3143 [Gluconacetobacter johannae DSM 13595]|nr:hypothetical protein AA13595_3143 [Gluconacetobacter johannae DSM 13595]
MAELHLAGGGVFQKGVQTALIIPIATYDPAVDVIHPIPEHVPELLVDEHHAPVAPQQGGAALKTMAKIREAPGQKARLSDFGGQAQ